MITTINKYYIALKPGIIYANILTASAGFFLASQEEIDWGLYLHLIVGFSLVIGSAAVLNNIIDRKIDLKMKRTKNRAIATGEITLAKAYLFSLLLILLGLLMMIKYLNTKTMLIGVLAFIFYVFIYAYFKRKTHWGTVVGAIPGASPPVAGYLAVSNSFDLLALALFSLLFFWQLPHFYAITIKRASDYKKAGIPVLSLVKGFEFSRLTALYLMPFYLAGGLILFASGALGYFYLIVLTGTFVYWLKVVADFSDADLAWSKSVFGRSILALVIVSITICLDSSVI